MSSRHHLGVMRREHIKARPSHRLSWCNAQRKYKIEVVSSSSWCNAQRTYKSDVVSSSSWRNALFVDPAAIGSVSNTETAPVALLLLYTTLFIKKSDQAQKPFKLE